MDTEVKKFVERSIKRGDSLDQIKSTLVSYGWEENVNEATGYYDEFKKKKSRWNWLKGRWGISIHTGSYSFFIGAEGKVD